MSATKVEAGSGVRFAFLTPRKLPSADTLTGRVVVLDIGFASEGGGSSFAGVTIPFLSKLSVDLRYVYTDDDAKTACVGCSSISVVGAVRWTQPSRTC